MAKVKVGVVGIGSVAHNTYLPGIVTFPNVELVAVCDAIEERARGAQKQYGAKEYYTDFDEMLKKADIEAVVDLTPIAAHGEINLKALRAHKHLYTEKSMATTMADADTMIAEAAKAHLKLACAAPVMLSPMSRELKRLQIGRAHVCTPVTAT